VEADNAELTNDKEHDVEMKDECENIERKEEEIQKLECMIDDNVQETEAVNEEDDQETDMIEIGKVDAKRDCCPESEQNDTSEIVDSQMGVEDIDELPTKKEVLMNEIGESANGKKDGDGDCNQRV
jgi:hypothetical protein